MSPPICLIVSDGRRGIENQALGLGEALARRVELNVQTFHLGSDKSKLPREQPAFWIGCGRAAVNAASAQRKAFPDTKFLYVQDPRAHHDQFDLIIPPRHDRVNNGRVFSLLGSPNRITAQVLNDARAQFADRLGTMTGRSAAILIGGQSKRHKLTSARADYLIERIDDLLAKDLNLLITDSRRTPAEFRKSLMDRYGAHDRVWLHKDDEPNPYFAFLAAADWIFVTEDSTNMLTESAATGTPVYRLGMDGNPGKFRDLYAELESVGAVRPYLGQLDHWTYTPLHETERAADHILEIFPLKSEL